jgi:hypothetical protein
MALLGLQCTRAKLEVRSFPQHKAFNDAHANINTHHQHKIKTPRSAPGSTYGLGVKHLPRSSQQQIARFVCACTGCS